MTETKAAALGTNAGAIRVRARELGDVEALVELYNCPGVIHGTLQLPWRSVEWQRDRLTKATPGLYSLVAELDGRVVGNLALMVEQNPRRAHCASIGMGVHDAAQGRGIGSALMAAMVTLADDWLNLRRIELTVFTDNAAAIGLYRKFGFEIEGTAHDYAFRAGTFSDAHHMARLRR